MNEVDLRVTLMALLRGGEAHVRIERALKDIRPEIRHQRPHPALHTIWEELEHMRISQHDLLHYTLDASWQSPKWPDGYWPKKTNELSEEQWNLTLKGFHADLQEFMAIVEDQSVELTAPIPHAKGHTYLREIMLAADHNAYHASQIVMLRKMLNDWQD